MSLHSGAPGSASAPTRASKSRLLLDRARFLAEASRLLAQSLDYEATLETVAKMAIPELGAWAIVDLVEDDGSTQRLAVVHPNPAKQALARELERGYRRRWRTPSERRSSSARGRPSSSPRSPTKYCAPSRATSATSRSCVRSAWARSSPRR